VRRLPATIAVSDRRGRLGLALIRHGCNVHCLRERISDSVLALQHTDISNDTTAKKWFETVAGRPVAAKKRQCQLLSNTVAEMLAATAAVTTAAAKRPLDAAAATAG
jgi:hypothetical protein